MSKRNSDTQMVLRRADAGRVRPLACWLPICFGWACRGHLGAYRASIRSVGMPMSRGTPLVSFAGMGHLIFSLLVENGPRPERCRRQERPSNGHRRPQILDCVFATSNIQHPTSMMPGARRKAAQLRKAEIQFVNAVRSCSSPKAVVLGSGLGGFGCRPVYKLQQ